jgi:zinc-binding alcohol dehydrogenase family protein
VKIGQDTIAAVGYDRNLPADDPGSLIDVEVPTPEVGPHDLLVEVHAVSVNPVDVKQRSGADPHGTIRILGFDAAGVVQQVGEAVTLFAPGDEVYYAGAINRPGTDAALHAVDERIVGKKPRTLSFAEAAALPLTTITAWEALVDKLKLNAQSTGDLLIMGASGGVGSMVVQLARALAPEVRIIGSTSGSRAEQWVRSLGAHEIIDYHGDVRAQLASLAPAGVHYIFTVSSKDELELYASLLRPFGEIVGIGDPEVLNVAVLKSKSLSWHWEFMFARSLNPNDALITQHQLLDQVADLVDSGQIRSTLSEVLSPIDAAQLRLAHRRLESGGMLGKIVVSDEPFSPRR